MSEVEWLAGRFEENRPRLRAVAYRMLGSLSEAEDAVQESWLRLSRADTSDVRNLDGWLTTVVARVSLDMLRSRTSRREDPLDTVTGLPGSAGLAGPAGSVGAVGAVRSFGSAGSFGSDPDRLGPEEEALLADSVGPALLVVLETLAPAERLAFVLHDRFGVPFDEIAPIVGRSPAAARQLASRARRRVQGAPATAEAPGSGSARQRQIVDAFLAASRNGDFEALLAVLDPDVVLRADEAAVATGASALVRGATAVAQTFSGRARAARPALVDGAAGAVWARGGQPRIVFRFAITDDKITAIDLLAGDLDRLDLTILDS